MRKLKLFFACLLMAVLSIGQVWGADITGTINFGNATGSTAVNSTSVTGDDSQENEWTITTTFGGQTSFTQNATYSQIGASSKPASSITFTTTLPSSQTIKAFSAKFGGFNNTAGTVTLKVGNTTVGSGSLNATSDVTVNATNTTTSGTVLTVTVTGISKGVKVYYISYTYSSGSSTTPTLSLDPTSKEFNASGNSAQAIALTASNFSSTVNSVTCAFFNAAACESENAIDRPEWVNEPVVNDGKTQVSVNVTDNNGAARQTWMKITAGDGSKTASAIFAISQKAYVVDYATLPFDFTGGSADIPETSGMTQEGLGSDYTSGNPTTKLKFDGDGDWLIIKINAAPGTLSYDIKGNSIGGGSIFTIQESADGILYSDLATYAEDGDGIEHTLASSTRYVKFVYTDKVNGNIGLGNIHISAAPTVCANPVFDPAGGAVASGTSVSITTATAGAAIYYMMGADPADPTSGSTLYEGPISVTSATTIKAIAIKAGLTNSTVTSATYTIIEPRTVTFDAGTGTSEETSLTEASYGAGITLPSATPSSYCAAEGWTFAGWATSNSTTTAPTLKAGDSYDCAEATLYAVYQRGDKKYHLVTTLPTGDDIPGSYMIVNTSAKKALRAYYCSKTYQVCPADINVITDGVIDPADISDETNRSQSIWAVAYSSNHWTFTNGTKELYGYESSAHYNISVDANSHGGFNVSLDANGYAVINSVDETRSNVYWTGSYFQGTSTASDINVHLYKLEDAYSSTPSCCTDEVTIAKGAESNGTFTVKHGDDNAVGETYSTCTGAQVITVTCTPGAGYHVDEVTQSGVASGVTIEETSENVYTITYAKNATGTSTVSVTFAATTNPSISVPTTPIAVGDVAVGATVEPTFLVSAANLVGSTLTLSSSNDKFTLDKTSLTIKDDHSVDEATIKVTLNTSVAGDYSTTITLEDEATPTTNKATVTVSASVKNQYTINWYVNTVQTGSDTYLDGQTIAVPADPADIEGLKFQGWTTAALATKQQTAPDPLLARTAITTATANVDYYAVFAKQTADEWNNASLASLTNTDIFVIANNGGVSGYHAMSNNNGTSSAPAATAITVEDGAITSEVSANLKWNLSGNSTDGYTFYPNGSTTTWLYCNTTAETKANDNMRVGTGTRNVFEYSDGWLVTADTYVDRYLSLYTTTPDWRGYINTTTAPTTVTFFKYIAGSKSDYMTTCVITFNVTYKAGEGEGDNYVVENIAKNASYVVIDNDVTNYTKAGYKFNGWKEGTTPRAVGYEYEHVTEDITLIAQWTEKTDAGLAFDPTTYDAEMNGTFNAPILTNPYGLTVTYTSSDPSKATVDPTTGAVTLVPNAVGDVIITASSAETDTYKAGSASYTIKIGEAQASQTTPWVAATELYDGMQVLITGEDAGIVYAMGASRGNNRGVVAGTLTAGVYTPGDGAKAFTLEDLGENKWAIKTSTGEYLYAGGTTNSNNYLNTKAYTGELDANAKWSINLATGAIIASSSNRNEMRFNKNNDPKIISCYQSSSELPTVTLYTPQVYKRTVREDYYGTICLPKAGVLTNGVLYEISYYDADQKKIFFDEVVGGVMVAGAPYIFMPNENVTELKVVYTNVAVVDNAGHKNGLYGHYDLNYPTEKDEDARLFLAIDDYFLLNNEYWKVDQIDRVYVDNYRAYIKLDKIGNDVLPQAYGRRRIEMNVNGEQTATGMDELNASEAPVKMMINGQLFILRGEKMYDATGRLVK